jgi:hypothetical protein
MDDMDTPASVRNIEFKRALHATLDGARLPRKAIADIVGVLAAGTLRVE